MNKYLLSQIFKSQRHVALGCARGLHRPSTYDITVTGDMNPCGSVAKNCTKDFVLNGARCLCRDN